MEATAEKYARLILFRSRERMWKLKAYQPEHKAYMALAVAIDEAVRAFLHLDENMK